MKNNFISIFVAITLILFATSVHSAGFIKFPVVGYSKSTAPVTSFMDHDLRSNYIKTFKGETGSFSDGCLAYVKGSNVACNSATNGGKYAVWAFKRPGGVAWTVTGIKYIDAAPGTNVYMWYDNHKGYDFSVPDMTPVIASASGTWSSTLDDQKWGRIIINHGNGYRTTYTHMQLNFPLHTTITKGMVIGWVSDVAPSTNAVFPHLHFTVEKSSGGSQWVFVDPYGGSGEPVLWE